MYTLGASEGPLQRAGEVHLTTCSGTRELIQRRGWLTWEDTASVALTKVPAHCPHPHVLGVPAAPRCAHLPRAHDVLAAQVVLSGSKPPHHPSGHTPGPWPRSELSLTASLQKVKEGQLSSWVRLLFPLLPKAMPPLLFSLSKWKEKQSKGCEAHGVARE